MSAASLRGLTVWQPTGTGTQTVQFPPNSSTHRTVRDIITRSLVILESSRGRRALRQLAVTIVERRRAQGGRCLYTDANPNSARMDQYIDLFLQRMRSGFPEVYIKHSQGEAMTVRYDWAGRKDRLEDYQPVLAGQLQLSPRILQNMTATRNNDIYNLYMFQMIISVAHELGHFLTGFLTGSARPGTPNGAGVPGAVREAGYFWESLALGGIVDFFADPRDPNNIDQPGVPYIFDDALRDSRGRRVSMTWINEFVSGRRGFDIPVQPSREGDSTTRRDLRRITNEMSDLREEEAERAQRANLPRGPVTGGASASSASSTSSASRDRYAGSSQVSRYYY